MEGARHTSGKERNYSARAKDFVVPSFASVVAVLLDQAAEF
jgi:hypothetical protein